MTTWKKEGLIRWPRMNLKKPLKEPHSSHSFLSDFILGSQDGLVNVLVIGASTGYGLASRIASTFGAGAATLGIFLERPGSVDRAATAGWYNTAAFDSSARTAKNTTPATTAM